MWSEDPVKERVTESREQERPAEQASGGVLRWFFSFDGWRLVQEEDEFVLA